MPMCPLARAKTDSWTPSEAWSRPTSVSDHGSIGKCARPSVMPLPQQLGEVGWTTTSAPVLAPARRPARPGPPRRRSRSCPARPAATPDSASSKTTASAGSHAQRPRAGQEGVRLRLAAQPVARGDHAVDPGVDQVGEPGGGDHLLAVGRGGDDGGRQAGVLAPRAGSAPSPRRPRRRARRARRSTSSFLRVAIALHGGGVRARRPASPSGSSMPRLARKSADAVGRGACRRRSAL